MMNLPPAISRTETLELLTELRAATDPTAIEQLERRLVEGNLRFCAFHARKYRCQAVEFEDLIAVAAAALVDAVRRFDLSKSTHFAAYARRCIRRDLVTTIRRQASPIRLPREPHRAERENGREAVAAPRVFPLDELRPKSKTGHRPGAVDTEEGAAQARSGQTFGATGEHSLVTEDPSDGLLAKVDGERIAAQVASLPDRDATVVRMRFGLDGVAPHELAEIGAVLNMSKQRVQFILDRALASLRATLKAA